MPDNIRLSNPPTISTPRGYSHIAEVTGGGRIIYISGQVALDREGNLVGDGDMAAQAEQVYQNLKAALEAVGATFDNVVKMTSYIVDMSKMQVIRDVRDKYINTANPPASTAVGVTTLVHPKLLLEVEAVAVVA
jgi:enamine deaminase RidA (YjgF/YER057c/UK114 family)